MRMGSSAKKLREWFVIRLASRMHCPKCGANYLVCTCPVGEINTKELKVMMDTHEDFPVSYNNMGITVNGEFIPSDNPRLDFAKELSKIDRKFNPVMRGDYIINSIGFGFAKDGDKWVRIPHLGLVEIGEDVEIGYYTVIDRGTTGNTKIGNGTKIGNLVHIAHNAQIGENCLLVDTCQVMGSAVVGDRCFIGGGARILNKIKIGNDVTIGAGAVVTKDVPDGETWAGVPARKLK